MYFLVVFLHFEMLDIRKLNLIFDNTNLVICEEDIIIKLCLFVSKQEWKSLYMIDCKSDETTPINCIFPDKIYI